MKLIENTGWVALVEIDGVEWSVTTEEYKIMCNRRFYYWPYELKTINPMPHSCQRCKNRPVDFRLSNKRTFLPPLAPCRSWGWTKTAPFFDNPDCDQGKWDDDDGGDCI